MTVDSAFLDRIAELTMYARIGWAVAITALLLLTAFAMRMSIRLAGSARAGEGKNRLSAFHSDRSAIASMEYLLVLFPFLIIVMTIWQFAFMINAKLHVSYATYAAARSAAVVIPAEYGDETEGLLKQSNGSDPNAKWERILRAARPGTIGISPGNSLDAAGTYAAYNGLELASDGGFNTPQRPDALGTASRILLMSMHMCGTPIFCAPQTIEGFGTRPLRAAIKDYYAQNMTKVTIQEQDRSQDLDLSISKPELITVRVDYVFWLQVPYVGRLIEAMFRGTRDPIAEQLQLLNPYPSMVLSEQTTINAWFRKRATDPCP